MRADKDASSQSPRRRKVYARPKLTCFGKIAALTRTTGFPMGGRDGGHGKIKKTGII
jgi:hypothetical protein